MIRTQKIKEAFVTDTMSSDESVVPSSEDDDPGISVNTAKTLSPKHPQRWQSPES